MSRIGWQGWRPWALLSLAVVGLLAWSGCGNSDDSVELLNVSYDPTRELWTELNDRFVEEYEKESGKRLTIQQSHGGSASQARAVIDGLDADVVTLALWSDTNVLAKRGLLEDGWEKKLPNRSLPYFSTIVFVVRKGNPKGIKDWADLIEGDVKVITPNPQTSGNGKLSFLGAWGAVKQRGGSDAEALDFVTELYRRVPVLDTGARGSTVTFARRNIGDVHLTWENEAHLEVAEARGELEIVYPPLSIKAEPYVAVVDANVDRKGTRAHAEAYLKFLYTEEAQEVIARHHYRPIHEAVQKRHAGELPEIKLFEITAVAKDWDDAQEKYFAEGGVFEQVLESLK